MVYTKLMAFKEALSDTGIAAIVNIPLNFILLHVCINVWAIGTMWTSVIMTTFFTLFGITRKTFIRIWFDKEFLKKQTKKNQ